MSIHYESAAGTATITLAAPQRRNSLSPELINDLRNTFDTAFGDDDVRSIILTHEGNTFCAGADLTGAASVGMEEATAIFLGLLHAIAAGPKPIIAVVNGHVRAGGLGLLAACDVAFAAEDSSFGAPEPRIGVAPALIALTVLERMPSRPASMHLLAGDVFGAAEAEATGLITRAVADPAEEAKAYATKLLKCSPQGLRETKALVNYSMTTALEQRGKEMAATSARLFGSAEATAGIQAFMAGKPAPWVPGAD
ncbi:enoyl-CoA hydratase/isomerase family protein [Corynebacterium sp. TAE3-ERU12]|uniref:enoyl-CoA hydratase-related protein n=1 Tax=Corynebacterium sp. TAE3-ERU12 TaxID=2849491 RepID=UPI001C48AC91|nr:enoyl-CoA hydratase-related protein [Corynebacterium sp. TAE3-ERU12]MBV7294786.1 enoyl-CoA hydratase/isomerase family protein [Corynebacterium sp. TAE3-ERU12]